MSAFTSVQIRLVLDDLKDRAHHKFVERVQQLLADHSARGLLKSGATLKAAAQIADEEVSKLLQVCVVRIAPVDRSAASFSMIEDEVRSFLIFVEGRYQDVVRLAANGSMEPTQKAATALFDALRTRALRQVEIQRFDFADLAPNGAVASSPSQTKTNSPRPTNRGGKPMAAHWDDLWSSIAAQLYNGDLKPKTQADVVRAMEEWAGAQDVEVGDTAIKDRARALWKKLQAD